MKRTTLQLIVFANMALAMITTSMAVAADADGKYSVRGVGAGKCATLVSYIDSKDQAVQREAFSLYISWLDGYLSHLNRTEQNTYDASPFMQGGEFLAILSGQCRNNPDELIDTMALQVLNAMAKAKVQKESPVVEIKVGDKKGNFRKETIVLIQKKLIELKMLQGKADGEFGQTSQNAVKSFQKSVKQPESGFPDVDTVLQLTLK